MRFSRPIRPMSGIADFVRSTEVAFGGLKFLLETIEIVAAQIEIRMVFESWIARITRDVPTRRDRDRSPSSLDNNARHAEKIPRRLCDHPPSSRPVRALSIFP